jgi:hypothetical protein
LSTAEIPSHSHSSGNISTSSAGSHSHSFSGSTSLDGFHEHSARTQSTTSQNHTHEGGAGSIAQAITGGGIFGTGSIGGPTPNGNHSHNFSGNTGFDGSHTHSTSGNTGNAGSGGSHENRPPYYALAYIMKV